MTDQPIIELTRVDTSQNEALTKLARLGADSFGYKAELAVDRQLAQLLRLRVAQLNNCTYCLNLHYEAARAAGIPRPKVDTLTAWWETNLFTEAEQAALAYAEALTRVSDSTVSTQLQTFHENLEKHFDEEQITDIIGNVINMNIWTRLKLAEGAKPT